MHPRSHKDAVEGVRRLCRILGGACWVLGQSARLHGSAGLPDAFCKVRGRAFWVEVKVGADYLRPEQIRFKTLIEDCVPVVVGDAGDVMKFLGIVGGKSMGLSNRDWRAARANRLEISERRARADLGERELARMRETLEKALQWMADYDSPNMKEVGAGWIGVALRGGDFRLDAVSFACRGARELDAIRKKGGDV